MATITTTELATELNTTSRTARKFLRDDRRGKDAPIAGKGGRWVIEKREVQALKARFTKWSAAQEVAKAERLAKADAKKVDTAPEVEVDAEVEVIDEDPTDADLEMIELNDEDLDD